MSTHRVRNGTQGTVKLTLLTLDVWDLALWPPSGPWGLSYCSQVSARLGVLRASAG